MMKLTLAATLAFCCVPMVLHAQDAAVPAKTKKAPNPNRKTCRAGAPTGSHFVNSVCHTNAEWAEIDAASSQTQDNLRSTGGMQR